MRFLREAAEAKGTKLSELIREGALDAAARAKSDPSPRYEARQQARGLAGAAVKALGKIANP